MVFGCLGALIVAVILWDAFETVLVPRRIGRRVRLTRYYYLVAWALCRLVATRVRRTSPRESLLGFFGPMSLIVLIALWAGGLIAGFALLQFAAASAAEQAQAAALHLLYMSGETFFTLGFGDVTPHTHAGQLLAVLEAGMGFGFLGTVIGYLPTQYSSFAQREVEISLMDTRAGSPPTATEFLRRLPGDEQGALRDEILRDWERWSAQLLETHISYPQLAYYRSQHINQSWLATLTVILDSSALILACSESKKDVRARRTFAMARHALVDISQIFVSAYTPVRHDRLAPEDYSALREALADSAHALPEGPDFEARLARLRLLYEPYAQALAGRLLYTLPAWVPVKGARDNWMGGPWDRLLGSKYAAPASDAEHF
jgi:hypothetical protein